MPTVPPDGPCVGLSVIAGAVIVNDAAALSKLPSESDPVAVIVYPPAGPFIVNVHPLNAPVAFVMHKLGEPIDPLPLIENVIVMSGVNPVPDTFSVAPLGPCVSVSEIAGVVMVNPARPAVKAPVRPRRRDRVASRGSAHRERAAAERARPIRRARARRPDRSDAADRERDRYAGRVARPGRRYRHSARSLRRTQSQRRSRDRESGRRAVIALVRSRRGHRVARRYTRRHGERAPTECPAPTHGTRWPGRQRRSPLIVNATVTPAVNPPPDAVTVTPLSPSVGESASVVVADVRVNVADAVSVMVQKMPQTPPMTVTFTNAVIV